MSAITERMTHDYNAALNRLAEGDDPHRILAKVISVVGDLVHLAHLAEGSATPPDPAREPEVVDEPGVGAVASTWRCTTCLSKVPAGQACAHPIRVVTPATPTPTEREACMQRTVHPEHQWLHDERPATTCPGVGAVPTEGDGDAVEALARVLYGWLWRDEDDENPDTSDAALARIQPTPGGLSSRCSRDILAALDRGAIPGYRKVGDDEVVVKARHAEVLAVHARDDTGRPEQLENAGEAVFRALAALTGPAR